LRRHEVLRTRISAVDGRPVAVIAPARRLPLPLCDLGKLPADARRAEVRRRALAHARRPFDVERGPLLRAALLRLSDIEHVLLLSFHRLVADARSLEVVHREFSEALSRKQRSSLPRQYADIARRQRQWLQGEDCARQLAWWKRRLAGAPAVIDLPTDHPRRAVPSYRGARRSLALPATRSEALLLAAFKVLLLRTTGQQEIVVGSPVAGRRGEEDEALIGPLENPLVLRTDLSGDPEFRRLVERISAVDRAAREHRDLPFERLVEQLQPERDLNREPLFQVRFVFREAPPPLPEPPGLRVRRLEIDYQAAEFDWTLEIEAGERMLTATLEYAADLFDATTIRRALGHYRFLLEGIAADPARRLSELPLLGDAERHQLLLAWNDTRRPYPDEILIHELFEARAEETPEAVAVVGSGEAGERLSYRELNRRANRLAHSLQSLGVEPEVLVGICMERSPAMVVAILGVLKAGGAYLPLDPGYPRERLAFMLEDARVRVLLSAESLLGVLPEHQARGVCLDADRSALAGHSAANPLVPGTAANLAYLIYTSGSTGRAKGVAIAHRSAVAMVEWAREVFSPAEVAGVLASTSICFDLSIFELFVPLSRGGAVILAENALALPTLAAGPEVTLVNTVPSALRELLRLAPLPAAVQTVNLAGEPFHQTLVDEAHRQAAVKRVLNLYGPSEDTTYSTFARLDPGRRGLPLFEGASSDNGPQAASNQRLRPTAASGRPPFDGASRGFR
ncbi:MAG: AMP-binding protein, partial [bacterium]|nr:AMP-binding protein [bacterium]